MSAGIPAHFVSSSRAAHTPTHTCPHTCPVASYIIGPVAAIAWCARRTAPGAAPDRIRPRQQDHARSSACDRLSRRVSIAWGPPR